MPRRWWIAAALCGDWAFRIGWAIGSGQDAPLGAGVIGAVVVAAWTGTRYERGEQDGSPGR